MPYGSPSDLRCSRAGVGALTSTPLVTVSLSSAVMSICRPCAAFSCCTCCQEAQEPHRSRVHCVREARPSVKIGVPHGLRECRYPSVAGVEARGAIVRRDLGMTLENKPYLAEPAPVEAGDGRRRWSRCMLCLKDVADGVADASGVRYRWFSRSETARIATVTTWIARYNCRIVPADGRDRNILQKGWATILGSGDWHTVQVVYTPAQSTNRGAHRPCRFCKRPARASPKLWAHMRPHIRGI